MKKFSSTGVFGKVLHSAFLLALLSGLCACQSSPSKTEADAAQDKAASASEQSAAPTPVASAPISHANAAAELVLDKGIGLYEQGKYAAAIKKLKNSSEIWSADDEVKIKAHKYLAFSYCVTRQRQLCRHEFEKILDLAPAFELEAAEAGHPIWGAEFKQAKRHAAAESSQGQKEPKSKRQYANRAS